MLKLKRFSHIVGLLILLGGFVLLSPTSGEAKKPKHKDLQKEFSAQHDAIQRGLDEASGQHDAIQRGLDESSGQHDTIQRAIDELNTGGEDAGNHTLRSDTVLPAADRFVVLADFFFAAVLDLETGVVWQQSPLTNTHEWGSARFKCTGSEVGDRKGWRLPSVHELNSLVDPGGISGSIMLPKGHPFGGIQGGIGNSSFWSATTSAGSPTNAWIVSITAGVATVISKEKEQEVWCVRGGHNDGSQY